MKEKRVNRKDGALEETDKDLREQMRGEKRDGGENESPERKAMEGEKEREKGGRGGEGGQPEKERDRRGRERHQGREGSFELQSEIMNHE